MLCPRCLLLAASQVSHAKENQQKSIQKTSDDITGAVSVLSNEASNVRERAKAIHALNEATNQLRYLTFSHEQTLAEIIFVSLFSAFDAYVQHLLRHLYSNTPDLLTQLESRQVQLSDVLSRSQGEIVNHLIDKDIDALLRRGYPEVFEKLAKRFKVDTLIKFKNWPVFIECSQRRNLLTHCDGLVNSQYLGVCKDAKVPELEKSSIGQKLTVSITYLQDAIDIVTEDWVETWTGPVASGKQSVHQSGG